MSKDKKKFGGGKDRGGGQRGATSELGTNVYVCEVPGASEKFVKTTERIASYVGSTLHKAMADLMLGQKSDLIPVEPENLHKDVKKDSHEARKWDKQYDHYLRQKAIYDENVGKTFVIIEGQCTLAVRNKLKSSRDKYDELQRKADVPGLLAAIRNIVLEHAEIQFPSWAATQALKRFVTVQQSPDESLPMFYKRWMDARDVAERWWGPLYPTKLVETKVIEEEAADGDTPAQTRTETNEEETRRQFQACLYLAGVSKAAHGTVIEELCHQYLHGQNNYPKTVEATMTMLSHRMDTAGKVRSKNKDQKNKSNESESKPETSFAQKGGGKKTKYFDSDSDDSSVSSKSSKSSKNQPISDGWTMKSGKKNKR